MNPHPDVLVPVSQPVFVVPRLVGSVGDRRVRHDPLVIVRMQCALDPCVVHPFLRGVAEQLFELRADEDAGRFRRRWHHVGHGGSADQTRVRRWNCTELGSDERASSRMDFGAYRRRGSRVEPSEPLCA